MLPETIHTRLDATTLSSLSMLLRSDFNNAGSWADLKRRLSTKGYALREHAGRFFLITRPHGVTVCRVGALGHPSRRLCIALGAFYY